MTLGLLLTAFGFGLRHGVDWDHIAAIADLSGSSETRRRGLLLSFLYALGHAVVVFALGVAAIAFGSSLPEGLDVWMGRFVGLTLLALGVWVLVSLVRDREQFRLRSRWMLVIGGTFAGLRRVRRRFNGGRAVSVVHDHDHDHVADIDHAGDGTVGDGVADHDPAHDHAHATVVESVEDALVPAPVEAMAKAGSWGGPGSGNRAAGRTLRHHHAHHHDLALPDRFEGRYGPGVATGIGMLHGVGVESPTQIAVFVASTSVVGARAGIVVLSAWVLGLIVANSVLAVIAGAGIFQAERQAAVYRVVGLVVAVSSIAMGVFYLGGWSILPEINL
jgi:cytochrome c biogenesis protein CcdA